MPVAKFPASGPSTFKMDDRKRPVSGSDDIAPPTKRHQSLNGGSKSRDDENEKEAWLEEFQKDAIYRQMLEYKREKSHLEARLNELEKISVYHDDHLRAIDAWWLQLVQEVSLLAGETIPFQPDLEASPFLSALDFEDMLSFEEHISQKSIVIKSALSNLFTLLSTARGKIKPDVAELEQKINSLLATQKEFMVKLDKSSSEKVKLSQELNTATLRYFKAEKRLDRAKSAQVQRLEQQALAQATGRPSGANGVDTTEQTTADEETRMAYHEAQAVIEKQKEKLESALAEIKSLREELGSLQTRMTATLTGEEFSKTEMFEQFKAYNEDIVRRANHFEASNKQLREEADRLKSERASFQKQVENEAQTLTNEYEEQLRARDTDISRIRSARDDLYAELQMRKQRDEQERTALDQLKDLVDAKQDRVAALEAQVETIRPSGESPGPEIYTDISGLSLDDLRDKYRKLASDHQMAINELRPMEQAYKKTWALAHKKVADYVALEEKIVAAKEDKTKADHRYFAARKDMDTKSQELKALRLQSAKSSEIISQLKEAEASNKLLTQSLEKQLNDLKQANVGLKTDTEKSKASVADTVRRMDLLKPQLAELTNMLKTKDSEASEATEKVSNLEVELARVQAKIEYLQKERDNWKTKCLTNSSEEEQMLRQFALCTICRSNFKDTFLKTCGHVFCKQCVEDRIANRMRKCPNCSKPFDKFDAIPAHF